MACAKCRTDVFPKASSSPNAVTSTTFCFGQSGCVCIAACESTRWSELVGSTQCPNAFTDASKPPMGDEKPSGMAPWEITLVAIAVIIAVILFKRRREDQMPGWIQKLIKKFNKPSSSANEPATTAATTTAAVGTASGSASNTDDGDGGPKREGSSLFGWRVMREELTDNENYRLARVDDDRSPAAGFVQFAETTPSAPSFDDDMGHNNGKAAAPPSAPDL